MCALYSHTNRHTERNPNLSATLPWAETGTQSSTEGAAEQPQPNTASCAQSVNLKSMWSLQYALRGLFCALVFDDDDDVDAVYTAVCVCVCVYIKDSCFFFIYYIFLFLLRSSLSSLPLPAIPFFSHFLS